MSEPLDLDAIKSRMVVHEAQDDIMDALDDMDLLIAEVERLRAALHASKISELNTKIDYGWERHRGY